jgi:hypothetical protein
MSWLLAGTPVANPAEDCSGDSQVLPLGDYLRPSKIDAPFSKTADGTLRPVFKRRVLPGEEDCDCWDGDCKCRCLDDEADSQPTPYQELGRNGYYFVPRSGEYFHPYPVKDPSGGDSVRVIHFQIKCEESNPHTGPCCAPSYQRINERSGPIFRSYNVLFPGNILCDDCFDENGVLIRPFVGYITELIERCTKLDFSKASVHGDGECGNSLRYTLSSILLKMTSNENIIAGLTPASFW